MVPALARALRRHRASGRWDIDGSVERRRSIRGRDAVSRRRGRTAGGLVRDGVPATAGEVGTQAGKSPDARGGTSGKHRTRLGSLRWAAARRARSSDEVRAGRHLRCAVSAPAPVRRRIVTGAVDRHERPPARWPRRRGRSGEAGSARRCARASSMRSRCALFFSRVHLPAVAHHRSACGRGPQPGRTVTCEAIPSKCPC